MHLFVLVLLSFFLVFFLSFFLSFFLLSFFLSFFFFFFFFSWGPHLVVVVALGHELLKASKALRVARLHGFPGLGQAVHGRAAQARQHCHERVQVVELAQLLGHGDDVRQPLRALARTAGMQNLPRDPKRHLVMIIIIKIIIK